MEGQRADRILANVHPSMVPPLMAPVKVLSVAEIEKRGLSRIPKKIEEYDITF